MIHAVARYAFRLDQWLHRRLGRPYRITLTVGLMADIGHRLYDLPEHLQAPHHLIGHILGLLLGLGLLVHQVGEMHERLGGKARDELRGRG